MATSYTDLGMRKIADGDTNYGADARANFDFLNAVLGPTNTFWVSPEFTTANLGIVSATDRRHYDTIQGAITAWESRGMGANAFGAIFVFPGRYEERLAVTKSVGLYAVGGGGPDTGGAARSVSLRGDGTAGALVTFTPEAGEYHGLVFRGFQFYNTAAAQGSEQTAGILYVEDQGAGNYGSYQNSVDLIDCNSRFSNLNLNGWTYGLRVRGSAVLRVRGGHWLFPNNYSGGQYVRHPFYASGNAAAGKVARVEIEGARVTHWPLVGTGAPSSFTVYNSEASTSLVIRSDFSRTLVDGLRSSGGGSPLPTGLASATDLVNYSNGVGIDTATF